ncbi:hypothetical protein BDP55DRAFT_208077 [Colletotrichum godetiae]|uniref:Uncharacterized protein n=1 Tax=Colletotrichum godetiae TaxID=1209918 RepID=A0AAJ0AXX7_9PEZI|nr:uncharacterized protein BDP55DRAFT_208077 [Colletotrichum godetiae]KAK1699806.1 hypothetical protein BDP55DRAFT_208077 [Colletotrichum godetiae]
MGSVPVNHTWPESPSLPLSSPFFLHIQYLQILNHRHQQRLTRRYLLNGTGESTDKPPSTSRESQLMWRRVAECNCIFTIFPLFPSPKRSGLRHAHQEPDHQPQLRPHGVAINAHHGPAETGWPRPQCDVGQLMDPQCASSIQLSSQARIIHCQTSAPQLSEDPMSYHAAYMLLSRDTSILGSPAFSDIGSRFRLRASLHSIVILVASSLTLYLCD